MINLSKDKTRIQEEIIRTSVNMKRAKAGYYQLKHLHDELLAGLKYLKKKEKQVAAG